jgi:hypothetical protein
VHTILSPLFSSFAQREAGRDSGLVRSIGWQDIESFKDGFQSRSCLIEEAGLTPLTGDVDHIIVIIVKKVEKPRIETQPGPGGRMDLVRIE